MKRILFLLYIGLIAFPGFSSTLRSSVIPKDKLISVIILSGKNNHEWQKTTPCFGSYF